MVLEIFYVSLSKKIWAGYSFISSLKSNDILYWQIVKIFIFLVATSKQNVIYGLSDVNTETYDIKTSYSSFSDYFE